MSGMLSQVPPTYNFSKCTVVISVSMSKNEPQHMQTIQCGILYKKRTPQGREVRAGSPSRGAYSGAPCWRSAGAPF